MPLAVFPGQPRLLVLDERMERQYALFPFGQVISAGHVHMVT
jgi:hypothetical protein